MASANRAARRRQQREGTLQKTPRIKAPDSSPTINVYAKDGLFVMQTSLGPGYVAEMKLPVDLAENYVKECEEVVTELRTGLKIQRSSGLITP